MVTWAGFQVQDYGNLACLFPGVSARSQADSLLDDGAWRRRWDSEKPVWLGQEKRTVRGSLPTPPHFVHAARRVTFGSTGDVHHFLHLGRDVSLWLLDELRRLCGRKGQGQR